MHWFQRKQESEFEKKLKEAVSNERWSVSNTQLNEICDGTLGDSEACGTALTEVWGALAENTTKWRRVTKGLSLLEALLKSGDPKILEEVRGSLMKVRILLTFQHNEGNKDCGKEIQDKAGHVIKLVEDDKQLNAERKKAKQYRNKFGGLSSADFAQAEEDGAEGDEKAAKEPTKAAARSDSEGSDSSEDSEERRRRKKKKKEKKERRRREAEEEDDDDRPAPAATKAAPQQAPAASTSQQSGGSGAGSANQGGGWGMFADSNSGPVTAAQMQTAATVASGGSARPAAAPAAPAKDLLDLDLLGEPSSSTPAPVVVAQQQAAPVPQAVQQPLLGGQPTSPLVGPMGGMDPLGMAGVTMPGASPAMPGPAGAMPNQTHGNFAALGGLGGPPQGMAGGMPAGYGAAPMGMNGATMGGMGGFPPMGGMNAPAAGMPGPGAYAPNAMQPNPMGGMGGMGGGPMGGMGGMPGYAPSQMQANPMAMGGFGASPMPGNGAYAPSPMQPSPMGMGGGFSAAVAPAPASTGGLMPGLGAPTPAATTTKVEKPFDPFAEFGALK
eukprot:TRINITY_DN1407_c0_g1_i2.p1 TRINITY_DN1407_c0_g1~~TRINITY_DN1407_c0_g1_i2.p1  ORF type:complete len:554 (-),score=164.88 TRINITY_DN1407_c0_g1_i2:270-1931(-)